MDDYITRKIKYKQKNKYTYSFFDKKNNKIDKSISKKLMKGLYIPPAYRDVKINLNQREKILAIGYDEKDRPQYIYNKTFTKKRDKNKFLKMIDFGESYKKIMNQVKRDINTEGDNKNKQIAMSIMLVVECGIRVGSEKYRDENNSFGATTLEPRHFKIKGDTINVDFIGKKGVRNTGKIRSKRLSKNLRTKKKSFRPNEPIFSYQKGDNWYSLKAIDVNKYLKKFGNFSSKNFRTWVANLSFITELMKFDKDLSENKKKSAINESIQKVADKLNNTKGVCKQNYIDPSIINIYLNDPKRFYGTFKDANTKEEISEKYIELLKNQ